MADTENPTINFEKKSYERVNWQNGVTPLNASNLNKMDEGIDYIDDKVDELKEIILEKSLKLDNIQVEGSFNSTDYVKKTTTIAGLSLENNINADTLRTAIGADYSASINSTQTSISEINNTIKQLDNTYALKALEVLDYAKENLTIKEYNNEDIDETLFNLVENDFFADYISEEKQEFLEAYPYLVQINNFPVTISENFQDIELSKYSIHSIDIVFNNKVIGSIGSYFIDDSDNNVYFFASEKITEFNPDDNIIKKVILEIRRNKVETTE